MEVMSTDRELLVLAAKAAGIEGDIQEGDIGFWVGGDAGRRAGACWNPLADDGHALRLAVKLRIQVTPGTYNKDEFTAYSAAGTEAREHWSSLQDDSAATRRAIVRAAAEIGRTL